MGSYDFAVDIAALIKAATKTAEVVKDKKDRDICDSLPDEASVANDIVWDAVSEFQDRWERGINDMTDDISEVSGRLGKVAQNYLEYDEKAKAAMSVVTAAAQALPTTPMRDS